MASPTTSTASRGTEETGTRDDLGCNDGIDNDGDGDIDGEDSDCSLATDSEESPWPQCDDGEDNDPDGYIDLDDPDCAEWTYGGEDIPEDGFDADYECNDGVDNDGDGAIDSEDTACSDALDVTENNKCNNGEDDDGDGWTDLDPDREGDPDGDDEGTGVDIRSAPTARTTTQTASRTRSIPMLRHRMTRGWLLRQRAR